MPSADDIETNIMTRLSNAAPGDLVNDARIDANTQAALLRMFGGEQQRQVRGHPARGPRRARFWGGRRRVGAVTSVPVWAGINDSAGDASRIAARGIASQHGMSLASIRRGRAPDSVPR